MTTLTSTRLIKTILTIVLTVSAVETVSAADSPPAATQRSEGRREKVLMDFGWRFHLGDAPDAGKQFDYPEVRDLAKTRGDEIGKEGTLAAMLPDPPIEELGINVSFVQPDFNDNDWRPLDLPHDWAVELPFATNGIAGINGTNGASDNDVNEISGTAAKNFASHGFKPVGPLFPQNSIGWYRKEFNLSADDKGKVLWLDFDGVYRNSLVWLNGHCLGRHLSGYSSFRYDISQFANYGGKNVLVVRVDASRFEGWFYEGAGIYRHVWLKKTAAIAIAPDGIFVWSEFSNNVPQGQALIQLRATVTNAAQNSADAEVKVDWDIIAPDGKTIREGGAHETEDVQPNSETQFSREIGINSPVFWSPENPKLY